jgi:putative acetyltransferase
MDIREDDLIDIRTLKLIQLHLQGMAENSPPESRHALNVDGLRQPNITFYSAWNQEEIMGCGALKELTSTHGEVKSMRTATEYLKKGVAAAILQHIINESRNRGYTKLSLETGSMDSFKAAHRLYERFAFEYCGPFDTYKEDPNSVFMTLEIK